MRVFARVARARELAWRVLAVPSSHQFYFQCVDSCVGLQSLNNQLKNNRERALHPLAFVIQSESSSVGTYAEEGEGGGRGAVRD